MGNIDRIEDYFRSGCKANHTPLTIGLELEHFVVQKDTHETIGYYGERGVEKLLERISDCFTQVIYADELMIGLYREDFAISLEPGAQIEISVAPRSSIEDINQVYMKFIEIVQPILLEWGAQLVTVGYQPQMCANEIALIPKYRYVQMDDYFSKIGCYGAYMMKGTAATQVSIDYYSEADFCNKLRIALVLSPVFSLICENSPKFERMDNSKHLLRLHIWENVDRARTDFYDYFDEHGISFQSYAEFAYHIPLIVAKHEDELLRYDGSAASFYGEKELSVDEIEHILSMMFPDVRVKKYLEIRVADSLPIESALAYAALIKGLFADIDEVSSFVERLEVARYHDIIDAKHTIMEHGYDGTIYGTNIRQIIDELFTIANRQLPSSEQELLVQFQRRIKDR